MRNGSMCYDKESVSDACASVWLCVKKHTADILSSLEAGDVIRYENNVKLCMEVFFLLQMV